MVETKTNLLQVVCSLCIIKDGIQVAASLYEVRTGSLIVEVYLCAAHVEYADSPKLKHDVWAESLEEFTEKENQFQKRVTDKPGK